MKEQKHTNDGDHIQTETAHNYEIPEGGSLGLLALGYQGIMAWRHKRAESKKAQVSGQPPTKKND